MSPRKKQRWFCHQCHRSFLWKNSSNKYVRQFVWFKHWIVDGYTFRQLADQSGHSISTIRRIIEYWLQQSPPENHELYTICSSAIIDGSFIKRRKGVLAIMDADRHNIVYGSYNISEGPRDLRTLFRSLVQRGLSLRCATIDGNPPMSLALQNQWPGIVLQRCLIHIQRQGLRWCRRNPKRTDAQHLRELFLEVTNIHTATQRDLFLDKLKAWEQRYGFRIAVTPERGYVFSDLKRARSMLLAALPNMFHYLSDPSIKRSTNALEGYFARLKQRYREHRGLARDKRDSYFRWYFSLCTH